MDNKLLDLIQAWASTQPESAWREPDIPAQVQFTDVCEILPAISKLYDETRLVWITLKRRWRYTDTEHLPRYLSLDSYPIFEALRDLGDDVTQKNLLLASLALDWLNAGFDAEGIRQYAVQGGCLNPAKAAELRDNGVSGCCAAIQIKGESLGSLYSQGRMSLLIAQVYACKANGILGLVGRYRRSILYNMSFEDIERLAKYKGAVIRTGNEKTGRFWFLDSWPAFDLSQGFSPDKLGSISDLLSDCGIAPGEYADIYSTKQGNDLIWHCDTIPWIVEAEDSIVTARAAR